MSTPEAGQSRSPKSSLASQGGVATRILKEYSCIVCKQRKIRCDRGDPCSACLKAQVQCLSQSPAPPRRKKQKRDLDGNLEAKIERYERLLREQGVDLGTLESEGNDGSPNRMQIDESDIQSHRNATVESDRRLRSARCSEPERGKLIMENGRSRYFESNLWKTLSDEFRTPKEMFPDSSEDEQDEETPPTISSSHQLDGGELIFGFSDTHISLRALHPQPAQIFKLWQIFLENFNPLTKAIHAPTVQQKVVVVAGNSENVPKSTNALMFAIYLSAVSSMTESDCQVILGEAQSTLLSRYHAAAQKALITAKFLKSSDLTVIQAFVIYLLCTRQYYDSRSFWTLVGLAVRIGQRMGLHRDGSSLGLPFFEAEMRRRIWWLVAVLDGSSSDLSGSNFTQTHLYKDVQLPLNVNDSDLDPQMVEPPLETPGAKEMIFCSIRYEIGKFISGVKERNASTNYMGQFWHEISLAERDKVITDLEKVLEDKYLRYCDPILPLHFLSSVLARSAVIILRIKAHHPRQSPDRGASMSQEEKDMLFANSLRYLEYENVGHTSQITQRFHWHTRNHFQWHAFIYALSELRRRTSSDGVDKAWEQVRGVYSHHPEMLSDRGPLYRAVGSLAIKAWEAYGTTYLRQHGRVPPSGTPNFITILRAQKSSSKRPQTSSINESAPICEVPTAYQNGQRGLAGAQSNQLYPSELASTTGLDPPFSMDNWTSDSSPMDWAAWDNLLRDFELQQGLQFGDSNGSHLFGA